MEGKARPAGAGKRLFRVSETGTLCDSIKNAQGGEPYAVCLPAFGLAAPVLPVLRRKFKSGRNDRDSEHKRIRGKLPDNFDEESGFADRYARRCSGNGKPGRSMATSVLCEPGRIWEKLPLLHFLAAKVLHFDLKKADGLSGPGDLFLHQRLTGVVFHGKLS